MSIKKNKIFEKIINVILDILIFLFGVILLISIYKGIQVKVLGNDYSSFFGYSVFEVQTGSMADTINIGDWIIVKETDKIKVNDIVTFKKNEDFITHRVVESYKGTYITKGDANNTKDDPITKDQIVGTVKKILPHFGIFRKTLFNPVVLITLIITLYVIGYVVRKNKEDKKQENKSIDSFLDKLLNMIKSKKIAKPVSKKEIEKKEVKEEIKEEIKEEVKEEPKVEEVKEEVKFEEVTENTDSEVTAKDLNELAEVSEEDLDKTMYFRAIRVDKDEVEETLGKIEENQARIELEEQKEEEKKALKKQKEEEARLRKEKANEEVDESIIKEELEMLKKKADRKFSNIIDKVMFIKEQELNKIVEVLNNSEKLENNEASIKNNFIKSYIDVKYYNYCGNYNAEYTSKNMTVKIVDVIKDVSEDMIKNYKGNDESYEDKVMKYTNIFILVMYLEQADGDIEDTDPIKEMFKKKITKYFKNQDITDKSINEMIDKIIDIQKIHKAMIKHLLKALETNTFNLEYNNIVNKKNLYALNLKYNINFSKVYSDYILDKTYTEGVVAEDKVAIMMNLLSIQLVDDMLTKNFKKKYILFIPGTLLEKSNKLVNIAKISENEYFKNSVYMLIKYEDFVKNKKVVTDAKKNGHMFTVLFDNEVNIKTKDESLINIMDYVFIDKKVDASKITPCIPKDLSKNTIVDSIVDKISGGDK